jgi:hypothetical protein
MPVGVVKSSRDEHLWSKAKERAASEGKSGNWAYVMGIYKHMKGGNLEKGAAENKERKINWPKLLGAAAVTGLVAKSLGSFAEKFLERKFGARISASKILPKWAKKPAAWAAGRGLTGAGTGAMYAASTAYGLSKDKKKEKKSK